MGLDAEMTHDFLKRKFLTMKIIVRTHEILTTPSTAKLSVPQFMKYLSKVRQLASIELALYIPEPNELDNSAIH